MPSGKQCPIPTALWQLIHLSCFCDILALYVSWITYDQLHIDTIYIHVYIYIYIYMYIYKYIYIYNIAMTTF